MNQGSTNFLRLAILLIGVAAAAIAIFALPAGIKSDNTGFYRPILIGMYFPAIPFFIALYQGWKILGFIDQNKAFSESSIKSLKNIKYSAYTISGLYTVGMPYIFQAGDKDDAPGVVAIGLVIIFAAFVIATFAAVLQKLIQSGMDIKSENDLTV
jgi:hypothetical protein